MIAIPRQLRTYRKLTDESYCAVMLELRAECERRDWSFRLVVQQMAERWLENPEAPEVPEYVPPSKSGHNAITHTVREYMRGKPWMRTSDIADACGLPKDSTATTLYNNAAFERRKKGRATYWRLAS